MRIQGLEKILILFSLLAGVQNQTYADSGRPPDTWDEQSDLHLRCVQIGKRADADITEMVPHRVWMWRLNFEKSRQRLDQLRRDLDELRTAEDAFVASLNPEQKSKLRSQLESLQTLWVHLESDAQSLDSELRKGYPTRWHVARDAFDMQKEIRHWNKLHDEVAARLGLRKVFSGVK